MLEHQTPLKERPIYTLEGGIQIFLSEQDRRDIRTFLYPEVGDPLFSYKLSRRKEFREIGFADANVDRKHSLTKAQEKACNADFERLPHQNLLRVFLSNETPYRSLLLYHGLGTGKTCSAISVAEDIRAFLRQSGTTASIIVVASPNVQENFRAQLFDPNKLRKVSPEGMKVAWSLESCVGPSLLKEIDPTTLEDLKREDVENRIYSLIERHYKFYGYNELQNYLNEMHANNASQDAYLAEARTLFSGRLIIIDEVHNITRNRHKEITNAATAATEGANVKPLMRELVQMLTHIAQNVEDIRFILMSATPIYNNPREIVNLVNLMNATDRREMLNVNDVFASDDTLKNRAMLVDHLYGYVSFVRGENPYSFPMRLYPSDIPSKQDRSVLSLSAYPQTTTQGRIRFVDVYLSEMSEYQFEGYSNIVRAAMEGGGESLTLVDQSRCMQVSNMVVRGGSQDSWLFGAQMLNHLTDFDAETGQYSLRTKSNIFSLGNIGKYSCKIRDICETIDNSRGIVIVYSKFLESGLIPLALTLESMGFSKYRGDGMVSNMLHGRHRGAHRGERYAMITGSQQLSKNNEEVVKQVSLKTNSRGENIRVVLLSEAGAEGLDFKNVRQIHILDPWYTMSHIEQVIGRAIRNLSHCALPIEERCVEVYMHAAVSPSCFTNPSNTLETVDLNIYRYAESKAVQIGVINRLLKTVSIDCFMNMSQSRMRVQDFSQTLHLLLSTLDEQGEVQEIEKEAGDQAYSALCDYMAECLYSCSAEPDGETPTNSYTYSEEALRVSSMDAIDKIARLFRESSQPAFHLSQLTTLMNARAERIFTEEQIYYALRMIIGDRMSHIVDRHGRRGRIKQYGSLYAFLPIEITDPYTSLRHRQNLTTNLKDVLVDVPNELEHEPVSGIETLATSLSEAWNCVFGRREISKDMDIRDWLSSMHRLWVEYLGEDEDFFNVCGRLLVWHYIELLNTEERMIWLEFGEAQDLPEGCSRFVREYVHMHKLDNKKGGYAWIAYDVESESMIYKISTEGLQATITDYSMFLIAMGHGSEKAMADKMRQTDLNTLENNMKTYGFMGTIGNNVNRRMGFKVLSNSSGDKRFNHGFAVYNRSKKALFELIDTYFNSLSSEVVKRRGMFDSTIASVNNIVIDMVEIRGDDKFYNNSFLAVMLEFFMMLNNDWFTIAHFMFGKK